MTLEHLREFEEFFQKYDCVHIEPLWIDAGIVISSLDYKTSDIKLNKKEISTDRWLVEVRIDDDIFTLTEGVTYRWLNVHSCSFTYNSHNSTDFDFYNIDQG